jgi:hypothetical protein
LEAIVFWLRFLALARRRSDYIRLHGITIHQIPPTSSPAKVMFTGIIEELGTVDIRPDGFSADVASDTLRLTNLDALRPGSRVNLKRLTVEDRKAQGW